MISSCILDATDDTKSNVTATCGGHRRQLDTHTCIEAIQHRNLLRTCLCDCHLAKNKIVKGERQLVNVEWFSIECHVQCLPMI